MTKRTGRTLAAALLAAASVAAAPAAAAGGQERGFGFFRPGGGHLGVVLGEVGADDVARLKLSEERGAVVREVVPGSPAAQAGLQPGDVVLAFQGEPVLSAAQLTRLVRETPPGRKVAIEVSRDGSLRKLSATLEGGDLLTDGGFRFTMPPVRLPRLKDLHRSWALGGLGWEAGPRKLGIEYQEIEGQLARYFRAPADQAILVSSVEEDGPAARAGIEAGDLLLKIDGKAVRDAEALQEIVGALPPGQETTATVQRNGAPRDLKLKVGGEPEEQREEGAAI